MPDALPSSPAAPFRITLAARAHRAKTLAIPLAAVLAVMPLGCACAAAPLRVPARLVTCALGHATNFNPELQQTVGDLTFDTSHRLTLYIPATRERSTPPPDATEAAEPVNPRTRVIDDPDGIAADAGGTFDRVVDLWPERVELARTLPSGAYKTFLVSNYDPASGTARMFLGTAAELTTYDLARIYMGQCTVMLDPKRSKRRR